MIEEKLTLNLLNKEFKLLNSNVEGIYLYYRADHGEAAVISVIHAVTGSEFNTEQYKHILEQIKAGFIKEDIHSVRLLSLIVTRNPEGVKKLCLEEDVHWIIDLNTLRLIIYETQASDFLGLREEIENIIAKEFEEQSGQNKPQNNKGNESTTNYKPVQQLRNHRLKIFAPVNTLIIALNILVFLIMHYTHLFGNTDQAISKGGVFWYDVINKRQYYRIISSMFMHFDLSHIFNNMLVLLFIGANLERAVGKFKYLLLYLGTGIIADITSIVYNMLMDRNKAQMVTEYSIGASGAIFGVVGAILFIIIINRGRLEDISLSQMLLFAVFGLYGGITSAGIDNAAHIGGFIAGLILTLILYRKPERIVPGNGGNAFS